MCLVQFTNAPKMSGLYWVLEDAWDTIFFSHRFPIGINTVPCALADWNIWMFGKCLSKHREAQSLEYADVCYGAPLWLVHRYPRPLKLKITATIFFPSTPLYISQSRVQSMRFRDEQVWTESEPCHALSLWLWASYLSTLSLNSPHL